MKLIHLTLTPTDEEVQGQPVTHGYGRTLLTALASLESATILAYNDESILTENGIFTMEFQSFCEDMAEPGGSYHCFDMGTPEEAFRIDRLPDTDPAEDTLNPLTEVRHASIRTLAQNQHGCSEEIQIDEDALVSEGNDNGAYVAAWVWCDFSNTPFDKEAQA